MILLVRVQTEMEGRKKKKKIVTNEIFTFQSRREEKRREDMR